MKMRTTPSMKSHAIEPQNVTRLMGSLGLNSRSVTQWRCLRLGWEEVERDLTRNREGKGIAICGWQC
jgi:hypothetical protein